VHGIAIHWEKRNVCRILLGIVKERTNYKDLDIGGRIIL
jgi:hypothetical protein